MRQLSMTGVAGAPPRPRNRRHASGIGLIAGASLIWLWLAYRLPFPFTVDRSRDGEGRDRLARISEGRARAAGHRADPPRTARSREPMCSP